MRAGTLLALTALLLAAGCLSLAGEDTEPDPQPAAETEPEASEPVEQPGPLERRPSWIPGEHWTVEVSSTLMDEPITWTRVVAGFTGDGYLVGQPAEEARPGPLLLHIPGMGEVSQANLSYAVHGERFRPLDFPLEEGKNWQTTFEGDPVEATVERAGEGQAEVTFCCERNITLVYDEEIRAVREMTVDDGFLAYEVRDHGFAHEGAVEVPVDREVAFFEGRLAGGLTVGGSPGPPAGQVEIGEEIDRVAFTQIVGNAGTSPTPETGIYREQAHLPNGSTVATEQVASTDGLEISFHETGNATGTWRFEHVAAGPGLALTEGIAYRQITRDLG